jgi:F-type H+-transporting ATPase subunit gamma
MPTAKRSRLLENTRGIKKTKQITKAMNMVAAPPVCAAPNRNMDAFRPYAVKFAEVLGSLAEKAGEEASPLLVPRAEVKKITSCCAPPTAVCAAVSTST